MLRKQHLLWCNKNNWDPEICCITKYSKKWSLGRSTVLHCSALASSYTANLNWKRAKWWRGDYNDDDEERANIGTGPWAAEPLFYSSCMKPRQQMWDRRIERLTHTTRETSEKESSGKKRCKNVFAFVLVCVRVCVRVRLCVYACVCVLAQGSAPPCGWHSDCIMTINEKVNGAFSYISYTFGLLPSTMALMTMANVFLWPSKFWIMARPERSTAFSHASRMWHATFGNISFLQPSGWQLSLAVG